MSEVRTNSITDAAGTGAPDFPNGINSAGNIRLDGGSQRGEATVEEWTAKVAEIKARYPYPEEV